MKLFGLSILALLISTSVFAAGVKDSRKGQMQIGNVTFEWAADQDPNKPAAARIYCPDKKEVSDLKLILNRQEPFKILCHDKTNIAGTLMLADRKPDQMGIFLDTYIGDDAGPDFDIHFEGMIAVWDINVTPPSSPKTDRDTWGVKFDSQQTDNFRKGFK